MSPQVDASTDKTPGWKFNQYEMKGVPLRVEVSSESSHHTLRCFRNAACTMLLGCRVSSSALLLLLPVRLATAHGLR